MKQTVYKYVLENNGITELEMPTDAIPLKAGDQNGLVLWAQVVEPETAPYRKRKFLSLFTGEMTEHNVVYIDTVQIINRHPTAASLLPFIVMHVYEILE